MKSEANIDQVAAAALDALATPKQFGLLARDYFARLMRRYLGLSRVNLKVQDISQRMSAGLPDVLLDLLEVAIEQRGLTREVRTRALNSSHTPHYVNRLFDPPRIQPLCCHL